MPNLNIADMTDEVLREIQHRLLQLQGAGMSQQEAARQLAPEDHNSITTLKTLQPIRAATGRVLEGNWQGQELNATQIVESVYGNRHFILKIGYMHDIGSIGTFRLQFIVMMPIDNNVAFNDVEVRAEAQRTADAFMHMLNMRRTPTPTYQPLPPPDQAIQPPLRELQGKQTRGLVFDDMYNAIQSNALDLIKQRNLK
jgi:hypothetical protein